MLGSPALVCLRFGGWSGRGFILAPLGFPLDPRGALGQSISGHVVYEEAGDSADADAVGMFESRETGHAVDRLNAPVPNQVVDVAFSVVVERPRHVPLVFQDSVLCEYPRLKAKDRRLHIDVQGVSVPPIQCTAHHVFYPCFVPVVGQNRGPYRLGCGVDILDRDARSTLIGLGVALDVVAGL